MVGGESPLILFIFSRSLTYRTPLSERLERAMSTQTKRSGSAQEPLWLLVC